MHIQARNDLKKSRRKRREKNDRPGCIPKHISTGQFACIVVTHDQPADIGHGSKVIHGAVIDLFLFLIEFMYEIAGSGVDGNIFVNGERMIRQIGRKRVSPVGGNVS